MDEKERAKGRDELKESHDFRRTLSSHRLSREGDGSRRRCGPLLRDLYNLCGSERRSGLRERRRGAAVGRSAAGRDGGGGEGRCGGSGTGGRGGGLDLGLVFSRGRGSSGGFLWSSRFVVVHLEDVLLEVSDPVLLHRQRAVKLHLTEPALQGVELSHQFDQRVGRWFGHQGWDGTCAWRLWRPAVPFCSLRERRVLQRPTLETSGQADVELAACHLRLQREATSQP